MIDINGFKWEAQFNDMSIDNNFLAYTDFKNLKIYIGNEAKGNDTQLMYHLRHEVTHAYLYSYGFKTRESFTVEELCDFIGTNAEKILALSDQLFKEIKEQE